MDLSLWEEKAKKTIDEIPKGTTFCVKDLFEGVEWESLEKGDRISFGKYFKNQVIEGMIENVSYICKKKNNSAKYIKL